MDYVGTHYIVIEDRGLLKRGMRCYCMFETEEYLHLYFEYPIMADVHEVKISKNNLTNLKIVL
jgi:hypothetical protein